MIGGYAENTPVDTDDDWPAKRAAGEAIARRGAACPAEKGRRWPLGLADERGVPFWRPDWDDPRPITSRHIVFNLSRPEKSLMLLAPLAESAGGWGSVATRRRSGPSPCLRSRATPTAGRFSR